MFVRASGPTDTATNTRQTATTLVKETTLLQPGTRLVARLEAAATTAVKTPVVASIEYNYERDGMVIVPAGAKVIGDVQQASTEGYLSVRFHTLQMPNGREEKIEGTGVALDQRPLKGEVSGKNTGKKILSRTLSGVGTIAAYVVGGGGAGLNRTACRRTAVDERRIRTEHQRYGSRQHAVLCGSSEGGGTKTPAPAQIAERPAQSLAIPTAQELRELMDLRREINRMYKESNNARPPEER